MFKMLKEVKEGIAFGLKTSKGKGLQYTMGCCIFFVKYKLGLAKEGIDFVTIEESVDGRLN